MHQRLIVEGNDGWALTQLCKSNNLPLPVGFTEKTIGQFVKSAGGYDNIARLVGATLKEAQISNIGIVVDANEVGAEARWEALRGVLQAQFSESTLTAVALRPEGIVIREDGKPTVGIWIMPDNQGPGYLEHFLGALVDTGTPLWQHTQRTVADLSQQDFCRFRPIKQQKAMLHTWLAWQEEPGRPVGVGIQAGYLNAQASSVEVFLNWMRATFQLESTG